MAMLIAELGDKGVSVYLDTSVIARRPDILASKRRDIDLVVLDVVEKEISSNVRYLSEGGKLKTLLKRSFDKHVVRRESAAIVPKGTILVPRLSGRLSPVDQAILHHLIFRNSVSPAILVTNDRVLADAVRASGIKVLGSREFYAKWEGFEDEPFPELGHLAEQVQIWGHLVAIGMCAVGFMLAFLIANNIDQFLKIASMIGPWFYGIFAIISAVLAFVLRARAQCQYGAVECLIGIAAIMSGVMNGAASGDLSDQFATLITVSGGVYIIVRGLDNMDRGDPPQGIQVFLDWLKGANG